MPFQLGYVSTANDRMMRQDLLELLTVARRINRDNDVTGLLLFDGRQFLQVLEGAEAKVREIFARIAQDPRHGDLDILFEESVETPQFEDWSMGFQALDGAEWMEFPGEDGEPGDLRHMVARYGQAKDLLLKMRLRGLDPDRDLATPA
jgi:hypothetical protein